jgi:hypothetical protein
VIDGTSAVPALEAAGWDDLLARAGVRDPLRRASVLGLPDPAGRAVPRALLVDAGGRTVAAAALGVGRERGLVTVRHLGHSPNWFDPEPPARDGAARRDLARALLDQPGDVLVLEELSAGSPLIAELRALHPAIEVLAATPTYRIATGDPRARPAPRRREVGRLTRRAAERGTPLRITTSASWDDVAPQLDTLLGLQARSWQGRPADPFTATPEGRAFVRAAIVAMGAQRMVRLARVDVGDQLGAFHLSVAWGTRAVVYKTAFDRDLEGLPGLGWASLLATIDLLASEGVRTIDLGGGGGDYKAHVAAEEDTVTVRTGISALGRSYLRTVGLKHALARRSRPA